MMNATHPLIPNANEYMLEKKYIYNQTDEFQFFVFLQKIEKFFKNIIKATNQLNELN